MAATAASDAVDARAAALEREFRPTSTGLATRTGVALLIAGGIFLLPLLSGGVWNSRIALAATFAIIGLSVNIITGHAGQLSLGHQAFVGMGAFASAYVVSVWGAGFAVAVVGAGILGAATALILGLVALRIRGLYLALITLAFGLMAEATIFNWRAFTQGGAGTPAPRPALFRSDQAYAYLCLLFLALVLFVDWRLVKSKAGRAIVAFRNDERVAATLGVNVTAYKLLAFIVGGFVAGVAGSLFAHRNEFVQQQDFDLEIALIWVLMAVVGGLGSRAGVVIGSAFFALFGALLPDLYNGLPQGFRDLLLTIGVDEVTIAVLTPTLGALLLVLTLTAFPGGIGQQLVPLRRWLAGGPLVETKHEIGLVIGFPVLVLLIVLLSTTVSAWGGILGTVFSLVVVGAVGTVLVILLGRYLQSVHRLVGEHVETKGPEAEEAAGVETEPTPVEAPAPNPTSPGAAASDEKPKKKGRT